LFTHLRTTHYTWKLNIYTYIYELFSIDHVSKSHFHAALHWNNKANIILTQSEINTVHFVFVSFCFYP
jgi:hypothetical protein